MKPILFSTPMVQAILDGRKTQTRRIVKVNIADRFVLDDSGNVLGSYTEGMPEVYPTIDDAPYQEGDILWVRETWQIGYKEDSPCDINTWAPLQACTPCHRSGECTLIESHPYQYLYKASPETHEDYDVLTWRPSIHMPKEAARIFLRVKAVRVERLQDITAQDAKSEGMHEPYIASETGYETEMIGQFRDLWDSLYAKGDCGWDANPWVWVMEFERISKGEVSA